MNCVAFVFAIVISFLCMPSVVGRVFKTGTKMQNGFVHAVIFSILFILYLYWSGSSMEYWTDSSMEGFTINGEPDAFYQSAYDKCMRINSPPFMGSVSDTINYCLNNISSRFVKMN